MKMVEGMTFEHRANLEDYWANAADSFEIRKRFWSRIPLSMVRATEVFRVTDQEEDSLELPGFEKMRTEPLALVDWSRGEKLDLADLMRSVVEYSKWWTSEKTKQLKSKGVP